MAQFGGEIVLFEQTPKILPLQNQKIKLQMYGIKVGSPELEVGRIRDER